MQPKKGLILFNGPYSKWRKSLKTDAFETKRWHERSINLLDAYQKEFIKYGATPPPKHCSLPHVLSTLCSVTVIDYGGGAGWVRDYLINSGITCVKDYYNIENEILCEKFECAEQIKIKPISLKNYPDSVSGDIVLYINSVIQYHKDNEEFLGLLDKIGPKFIVMDELYCGNFQNDIYLTQNYYDREIPCRLISESRLLEGIISRGYVRTSVTPYPSSFLGSFGPVPMENLDQQFRIRHFQSWVFKSVN